MIGHYLLGALRAFCQRKAITLINVLCLALGLTGFIVAYAVVRYLETSERHFANADRIHLVSTELTFPDTRPPLETLVTADHAAKYVKEEFPELDAVVRVQRMGDTPASAGTEKAHLRAVAVDSNFLDVFALKFLEGDAVTGLAKPRSVLITPLVAQRLFGSTNVLGRRAMLDGVDVTVTGMIEPLPRSSNFDFELVATWDVYEARLAARGRAGPARELWLALGATTTFALLPASDAELGEESFSARLADFSRKYVPADQLSFYGVGFHSIPLNSLRIARLDQMLFSQVGVTFSVTTLLISLGALILGLACINYASLVTAQAARQCKEIATRRVVGATSRDVLVQSLSQTVVHCTLALTAAIGFTLMIGPVIDRALDVEIRSVASSDAVLWSLMPLLLLIVAAVSGVYGALVSTRVSPSRALRASVLSTPIGVTRVLLVAIQFAAAGSLLVVAIVIRDQAAALRSGALGSSTESVVLLGNNLREAGVSFDAYRYAHESIPGVQVVSGINSQPWRAEPGVISVSRGPSQDAPTISVNVHGIDSNFFAALDVPLLAGRHLDPRFGSDLVLTPPSPSREPGSIVVDRALAEGLGFSSPQQAIGQLTYDPPFGPDGFWRPFRIVGVVENRLLAIQSYGASGSVYELARPAPSIPVLRVSAHGLPAIIEAMASTWERLAPNVPFDVRFADTAFERAYRPFGIIFHFLGGLVILSLGIAVAGLLAMTLHEIQHRFHEIAVRKALGANARAIARRLLRTFSAPVLFGYLLAVPLACVMAEAYLDLFLFRIDLSIWPFVLGLVATMAVACGAVALQTIRAARSNPARILRYE